jgi:hypothetical protein
LGNKLNNLESQFTKYAIISAAAVLLVLTLRMFIEVAALSADSEVGAGSLILKKLT